MAACKTCGQPITWAFTQKGRRIPLNPIPDFDQGNLVVVDRDGRDTPTVATIRPGSLVPFSATVPRYTSHFATCPHATEHRKPRQ